MASLYWVIIINWCFYYASDSCRDSRIHNTFPHARVVCYGAVIYIQSYMSFFILIFFLYETDNINVGNLSVLVLLGETVKL